MRASIDAGRTTLDGPSAQPSGERPSRASAPTPAMKPRRERREAGGAADVGRVMAARVVNGYSDLSGGRSHCKVPSDGPQRGPARSVGKRTHANAALHAGKSGSKPGQGCRVARSMADAHACMRGKCGQQKTPLSAGSLESAYGARERTRTSTKLPPLAPEASASTNSATRAGGRVCCDAGQGMSTHTGACRSGVYHPRDDPIPRQARPWPPRPDTVKKITARTPDRARPVAATAADARAGPVQR